MGGRRKEAGEYVSGGNERNNERHTEETSQRLRRRKEREREKTNRRRIEIVSNYIVTQSVRVRSCDHVSVLVTVYSSVGLCVCVFVRVTVCLCMYVLLDKDKKEKFLLFHHRKAIVFNEACPSSRLETVRSISLHTSYQSHGKKREIGQN